MARRSPVDVVVRETALGDGLQALPQRLPLVTHARIELDGLIGPRARP